MSLNPNLDPDVIQFCINKSTMRTAVIIVMTGLIVLLVAKYSKRVSIDMMNLESFKSTGHRSHPDHWTLRHFNPTNFYGKYNTVENLNQRKMYKVGWPKYQQHYWSAGYYEQPVVTLAGN